MGGKIKNGFLTAWAEEKQLYELLRRVFALLFGLFPALNSRLRRKSFGWHAFVIVVAALR
jgi:hypothetical protein